LIVEVENQQAVLALYAELERRRQTDWPWPQPTDVVPAARTVLIDGLADPEPVAAAIKGWTYGDFPPLDGPLIECPALYDGPDLQEVARHWGMSIREAIATHTATKFYVAFCGFAPGFAYLAGLPPELSLPRRPSPRPRVPARSVAVAGEYSAIYPRPSPGGWQLIGRTHLHVWDTERDDPAVLKPGMRVRFIEAGGG
jgi:KipI family sensor histidine kinase inhibitor